MAGGCLCAQDDPGYKILKKGNEVINEPTIMVERSDDVPATIYLSWTNIYERKTGGSVLQVLGITALSTALVLAVTDIEQEGLSIQELDDQLARRQTTIKGLSLGGAAVFVGGTILISDTRNKEKEKLRKLLGD